MTKVHPLIVVGMIVAALACGAPASSGTQEAESITEWNHIRSLPELVAVSDLILRGTVLAKVGEPTIPAGRVPVAYTEFNVRPSKVLKGQAGTAVAVLQLGRAGDSANTYPDFPLLSIGSEVVVFLRDVSGNPGLSQGALKFEVVGVEGIYVVSGGRVRAGSSSSALANLVAGKSLAEFETLVQQAGGR